MGTERSCTIYLLDGTADIADEFLDPEKIGANRVRRHELAITSETTGVLFVEAREPTPPKWASFFDEYLNPAELGIVSSASAALVIPSNSQWFAVTFGLGRYLFRSGVFIEGFGLRVTLNAVHEDKLRSIDKETFDAIANHSRQQANQETGFPEFGLDVERDLVRAVTGIPEDPVLGDRLSGKDALYITKKLEPADLPALLQDLGKEYQKRDFIEKFPWIENVKKVKDDDLTKSLDTLLLDRVSERRFDGTWLAPPEILDWSEVRWFSYDRSPKVHTDIHWWDIVKRNDKYRGEPLTKDYLSRVRVNCHRSDGTVIKRWPVYRSIHAELDYNGGSYLLSNAQWYQVSRDFVDEVRSWFAGFPVSIGRFPVYSHDSHDGGEPEYNKYVVASCGGQWALLDNRKIYYGGGRSQIELCDMLGIDGELVHVKRYSGSQSMSHLFAQGFVSAEVLRVDSAFREKAKREVPRGFRKVFELAEKGKEVRVTFGIIFRSQGPFVLPFFSMISLRHATNRLRGYNYDVEISRIQMEESTGRQSKNKTDAFGE